MLFYSLVFFILFARHAYNMLSHDLDVIVIMYGCVDVQINLMGDYNSHFEVRQLTWDSQLVAGRFLIQRQVDEDDLEAYGLVTPSPPHIGTESFGDGEEEVACW